MTIVAPTISTPVDNYVFLMGRPPIGEFIGFVKNMMLEGHKVDEGLLTHEWREANDHVMKLEQSEAGYANNPTTLPLGPQMQVLAQRVLPDPMFQRAYRFVPTDIVLVELDRLVVFQKFINLGFVETLKSSMQGQPTDEEIARLAFGLDRALPSVQFMQNAPNMYSFISPSNDLRFLEAAVGSPIQVQGLSSNGQPFAYIILGIGFGSNYLNALQIDGRLILNNGSHRAYALRELGITHAPCLVQRITRREELDLIASGDVQQNPDRYLKAVRPPVLKDYFDDKLRKVIQVPRKNRLVRVQFGIEQSDVPAA